MENNNTPHGYSAGAEMIENYLMKIFSGIAEKAKTPIEKVRVGFKVDKENGVFCAYTDRDVFDENFRPEKYMGVKIDMSGMVETSRMFLGEKISQLAHELSCKQEELEIVIYKNGSFNSVLLKNNEKVPIDLTGQLL